MEQILSYIGTILTWLIGQIFPKVPSEVKVALVAILVSLIVYLYNRFVVKPKAVKQGVTLGTVATSEAIQQEKEKPISSNYIKKEAVIAAYTANLSDKNVTQVDSKLDKAAKSIGGIGKVIDQAVGILKIVSPFFPKKK